MNATRKAKPKYCSRECFASAKKNRAELTRSRRFWNAVEKGEKCWEWTKYKNKNGYGKFQFAHGQPMLAHRFSYMDTYGNFDQALFVCHKCDNPSCVRPDHLFLGTSADNVDDCVSKGRNRSKTRKGTESNKNKLSENAVFEIYHSKKTPSELALNFGVSATAIRLIRSGKNWGWLTVKS